MVASRRKALLIYCCWHINYSTQRQREERGGEGVERGMINEKRRERGYSVGRDASQHVGHIWDERKRRGAAEIKVCNMNLGRNGGKGCKLK